LFVMLFVLGAWVEEEPKPSKSTGFCA
jgi:hypothetical protein